MPALEPANMTAREARTAREALEAVAALLDPRWYTRVLITGDGRVPCLTVSSRHARLTWDLYAHEGWFLAPGPDKLAPFSDPLAAARDLAGILDGPVGQIESA